MLRVSYAILEVEAFSREAMPSDPVALFRKLTNIKTFSLQKSFGGWRCNSVVEHKLSMYKS